MIGTMPPIVEFWFDFASTYSYPAAIRIERRAAAAGIAVAWQPFLLGPIFVAQGWNDSPFNIYPPKGRYMWRDLERLCAKDGVPFRRPSNFPRNGLLAARIANWFATADWVPDFCRAIFLANFAEDREIADPAVVRNCLDRLGLPGETLIADAQSPDGKAALHDTVRRAQGLGLFGAPSFVVADELFWGNDRLDDALDWAKRQPSVAAGLRGTHGS
jgi:2-hydroxychromene-2-carboxylate isomerase